MIRLQTVELTREIEVFIGRLGIEIPCFKSLFPRSEAY
jgi:hypothetical protein